MIRHRLTVAAIACAVGFVVVAALAAAGWSRLEELDQSSSSSAYAFTVAHEGFQSFVRFVTNLAYGWTVAVLTGAVALGLAVGRRVAGRWLVLTVSGTPCSAHRAQGRPRPVASGECGRTHGRTASCSPLVTRMLRR